MFNEKVSQQLRECARQCMNNPSLLYNPKLSFIKQLIEHYGGTIPKVETNDSSDFQESKFEQQQSEPEVKSDPESETEELKSESEESDLELDMSGVIGLLFIIFIPTHYPMQYCTIYMQCRLM